LKKIYDALPDLEAYAIIKGKKTFKEFFAELYKIYKVDPRGINKLDEKLNITLKLRDIMDDVFRG